MSTLALTFFNALPTWRPLERIKITLEASRVRKDTITELSKLTDKDLNDIGISRGDIRFIADKHYQDIVNDNLKGWV